MRIYYVYVCIYNTCILCVCVSTSWAYKGYQNVGVVVILAEEEYIYHSRYKIS